jgi:hypothetical protein
MPKSPKQVEFTGFSSPLSKGLSMLNEIRDAGLQRKTIADAVQSVEPSQGAMGCLLAVLGNQDGVLPQKDNGIKIEHPHLIAGCTGFKMMSFCWKSDQWFSSKSEFYL